VRSTARRPAAQPIARLAVTFATFAITGALLTAPANAMPAPLKPHAVVGPSSTVESLNGLSIAPDGSGGMVFLETVAGVPHVFVSRLEQGAWLRPERVDVGLSTASSQPQLVADDHGELIAAFVNSGAVYVSTARNRRQPFSTPQAIATGAYHPSVSLNSYGVGYLAYTARAGAGYDVDVDYFDGTAWHPASPQDVNVTAADNAGTGLDAPDVVAAGDGVGIVTWGENGHIYTRRVWGTATSVQTEQIDPPTVAGSWSEMTANSPRISVGDSSSYPIIVFREEVTDAGRKQWRVLAEGEIAERILPQYPVDGLTAGSGNATQPRVAIDAGNAGLVTAATSSNRLIVTPIAPYAYFAPTAPLTPAGGAGLPDAVPANAGGGRLVAWQQTRARTRSRIVVSYPQEKGRSRTLAVSAAGAPTDAALGLFAGGDSGGDAAVAWVQGRGGALSIDAAELLAPPTSTAGSPSVVYARHSTPKLHWPPASESWGPISYAIRLDDSVIGRTDGLAWQVRKPLRDGRHVWQLTSTNAASESSTGATQTLIVDTYPPVVRAHLSGARRVGQTLSLTLRYVDLPNPKQPGSTPSGIASATVNWGGHAVPVSQSSRSRVSSHIQDHDVYYTATVTHVYPTGGRHTVTATVTDRAGNSTTLAFKLVVAPGPRGRSHLLTMLAMPSVTAASPEIGGGAPLAATPPSKGALTSDGPDDRYLLGGTWLYRPDVRNVGLVDGWWHDNLGRRGWKPVAIPNSFNAGDLSTKSDHGSVGWYRRDFTLPSGAFPSYVRSSSWRWVIQFESVNYTATVWLNGHELGTHEGAYLPFEFVMSHLRAGVNQLVVRVDNRLTGADFPPPSLGGWWNYGGILDAVYVRPVAGSEIDNVRIRTTVKCPTCKAAVQEQATVRNLLSKAEVVSLSGRYGSARLRFGRARIRPGGTWTPHATVLITHPQLWAPGSPYLYHATFTLANSRGEPLAGYSYQSGIRQISIVDGQMYLNGRQLHLRGVNLHEQTVNTGAALSLAQEQQYISWFQQLGVTLVRAHYPLNPELEQMADQAGIMLWSEVPVYESKPRYQAMASWRRRAVALVQANIEANQNHPSILVWSVGNELATTPGPGLTQYIREAAAAANGLDPTRPVGLAISAYPGIACQPAYAPLQVIGVNEYFGWFDIGSATADRAELGPFMHSVRACYRNQAIIVSEFGFGANRNGPVEVLGTYLSQINALEYHIGVFNSLSWLSGATYFPLQDFASRPGFSGGDPLGTPPWVDKGVLDQYGNPKPAFSVMAALYKGIQQIGPPVLTTLGEPTKPARARPGAL